MGDSHSIFTHPQHPYTQVLINSILKNSPKKRKKLKPIVGEVDDFLSLPSGCYFHPRCSYSDKKCRENYPPLESKIREKKNSKKKEKGQWAACWYSKKIKN